MATHEISLTLNGAASMIRDFGDRCRLAGSVEEVERRVGREINGELIHGLFTIRQVGTDLWIEPTPEFHRVMAALDA